MEIVRPSEKIILSHDGDYSRLKRFNRDFGGKVHAIKLGASFPWYPQARSIHRSLHMQGVDMILDMKLEDEPRQMKESIQDYLGHGLKPNFTKLTVSGMAPTDSLVVAQETAGDSKIVVGVPEHSSQFYSNVLRNIELANNKLNEPIEIAMCNVADIQRVKDVGIRAVIATGVRLPGQDPGHHAETMTPYEACQAGADWINIGATVTEYFADRGAGLDTVLENMRGNG